MKPEKQQFYNESDPPEFIQKGDQYYKFIEKESNSIKYDELKSDLVTSTGFELKVNMDDLNNAIDNKEVKVVEKRNIENNLSAYELLKHNDFDFGLLKHDIIDYKEEINKVYDNKIMNTLIKEAKENLNKTYSGKPDGYIAYFIDSKIAKSINEKIDNKQSKGRSR